MERERAEEQRAFKKRVYATLYRELPASRLALSREDSERSRAERLFVANEIRSLMEDFGGVPTSLQRGELLADMLDELIRFGPIAQYLVDDEVSEVMVNHHEQVFVERKGRLSYTGTRFLSEAHLRTILDRILEPLGRRLSENQPMVDSRLPDGSRVNIILPPLAVQGPMLTIRKFVLSYITVQDLIELGSLSAQMARFIQVAVAAKQNILICGGTATGKTTLLNVLSSFIPEDERILTIEDAAELQLSQFHVGRLEARAPSPTGEGAVTIGDLFRNSLRMRPDRIIVGECRGPEALDMLQAMNSGHTGSMTTAHANSAPDALSRLETMAMMAGSGLESQAIRKQIASAIDLVVSIQRYADGTRKVSQISEITGMESDSITRMDLFEYKQTGISQDGRVLGKFTAGGSVPRFYETLRSQGIEPDMSPFS